MIELLPYILRAMYKTFQPTKTDWTPLKDKPLGGAIEQSLGQTGLLYNSRLNVVSGLKATTTFSTPPKKTIVTSPVATVIKPPGPTTSPKNTTQRMF